MSDEVTIRVIIHRFDQAEVPIPVFEVEVTEPHSVWHETFGSLELLNAFLLGVRSRSVSHIPTFRELPGGWNLTSAPWQLWPEKVPGE